MTAPQPGVRCPELAKHLSDLDASIQRAQALTAELDNDAFNWRVDDTRWSIAQCLDHLNKTSQVYLSKLPKTIGEAQRSGPFGPGETRRGIFARLFLYLTEPPPKARIKAPTAFVPEERFEKEDLVETYLTIHEELSDVMRSSDGLDLGKLKMPLPVIPQLQMRLGEIFAVLMAHERRHLWQAEQVAKGPGFPTE